MSCRSQFARLCRPTFIGPIKGYQKCKLFVSYGIFYVNTNSYEFQLALQMVPSITLSTFIPRTATYRLAQTCDARVDLTILLHLSSPTCLRCQIHHFVVLAYY